MSEQEEVRRPKGAVGVEIIEKKTGKVIEFIDCHGRDTRGIDKVRSGVEINMNHADYRTRLVLPEVTPKPKPKVKAKKKKK